MNKPDQAFSQWKPDRPLDGPKPLRGTVETKPAPVSEKVFRNTRVSPDALRVLERNLDNELFVLTTRGSSWFEKCRSFLWSVSVHVILMIVLALILLPGKKLPGLIEAVFSEEVGDQLDILTLDEGNLNPTVAEDYAFEIPEDIKIDDMVLYERDEMPYEKDADAPIFDQSRVNIHDMLSGRTDPGTKNDLLSKYGGNKATQEAVRLGLLWLKQNQLPDGGWSLSGPYLDGRKQENRYAATGLAILAFQGDGNTTRQGVHSRVVKNAWNWLLFQQKQDGAFCDDETPNGDYFYTHSICTIALCELLTMEESPQTRLTKKQIRFAAQSAVDFLVQHQNQFLGGWRYKEDTATDSDLSATTWALLALQTAKMANLNVPESSLYLVAKFLDSMAIEDGSRYSYRKDQVTHPASMAASGLMCRMYLGWERENPAVIKGAEFLIRPENLVAFRDPNLAANQTQYNTYGWYMCSMFLKQLGPTNKYWRIWNKALTENLPKMQETVVPINIGSWSPILDQYGYGGGRLFVTCMSIMCLEVYYRHLAIYQ